MKIKEFIHKNKLLVFVAVVYILLLIFSPTKALGGFKSSLYYFKEMLTIMPVIFILTALIEAWVPRQVIINSFGKDSGIKGAVLSFIFGSFSAGPIYAAFPVCKTLINKGASIGNVVIILSSWAVVKIPMLANEAKFLGPKFMMIRWILTTMSIFIMAYFMNFIIREEDMPQEENSLGEKKIVRIKEEYCMGCGICVRLYPNNFEIIQKKAKLKEEASLEKIENIEEIMEKCPAKAISFY